MSTSSPASSPGGSSSTGVSPLLHHRASLKKAQLSSQDSSHLTPSYAKKLSRRWSLDNLNDTLVEGVAVGGAVGMREGYVRDLRKQHQSSLTSIKDEEYPYMLSGEKGNGGAGATSHIQVSPKRAPSSRRILSQRNRSGSMELSSGFGTKLGSGKSHNRLHGRLVSMGPFSSSVDISVVPEDNEVIHVSSPAKSLINSKRASSPSNNPVASSSAYSPSKVGLETKSGSAKAFLKQRSSSLPRILPPIFDGDGQGGSDSDGGRQQQQERQSTVVVREMQKFVCRQAADVSTLLPLPIPTNWRQGKALSRLSDSSATATSSPQRTPQILMGPLKKRKQLRMLMANLAKIHGIFLVVKQSTPALYAEFLATLKLDAPDRQEQDREDKLIHTALNILESGEIKEKLLGQVSTLRSPTAMPFSVITHGMVDLERIVFRYAEDNKNKASSSCQSGQSDEPLSMCLCGFNSHSRVGSPLLDIFPVLMQAEQSESFFEHLLQEYHSTLARTMGTLRSSLTLTLNELTQDVKAFYKAGAILLMSKELRTHEAHNERVAEVKGSLEAMGKIIEAL